MCRRENDGGSNLEKKDKQKYKKQVLKINNKRKYYARRLDNNKDDSHECETCQVFKQYTA